MLTAVLLFCVGLLCLVKGGDWFVMGRWGSPAVPPARSADRGHGGVGGHNLTRGDDLGVVGPGRPRRDRLRQRHWLDHLQCGAGGRHHHRSPAGQGGRRRPAAAGELLLHRGGLLRGGGLHHRHLQPVGGRRSAGPLCGLYGGAGGLGPARARSPRSRRSPARGGPVRQSGGGAGAAGAVRRPHRGGRQPDGGQRRRDRRRSGRARIGHCPDGGRPGHLAARAGHGHHLPGQGARGAVPGQRHRGQPVQPGAGERRLGGGWPPSACPPAPPSPGTTPLWCWTCRWLLWSWCCW